MYRSNSTACINTGTLSIDLEDPTYNSENKKNLKIKSVSNDKIFL